MVRIATRLLLIQITIWIIHGKCFESQIQTFLGNHSQPSPPSLPSFDAERRVRFRFHFGFDSTWILDLALICTVRMMNNNALRLLNVPTNQPARRRLPQQQTATTTWSELEKYLDYESHFSMTVTASSLMGKFIFFTFTEAVAVCCLRERKFVLKRRGAICVWIGYACRLSTAFNFAMQSVWNLMSMCSVGLWMKIRNKFLTITGSHTAVHHIFNCNLTYQNMGGRSGFGRLILIASRCAMNAFGWSNDANARFK